MTRAIRRALIAFTGTAMGLTACSSTISGHGSGAPAASRASSEQVPSVSGTGTISSTGTPSGGNNPALSGAALEQATKAAVISAKAFRMSGSGANGSLAIGFDIHYGESSSRGQVTLSGQRIGLVSSGSDLYMKAGRQFWLQYAGAPDTVVTLLQDKWVHLPPDSPGLSDLADLAIRERFIEKALSTPDTDTYTIGPAKTINGVPAVSFVTSSDGSIVYVPATGTPFPIRIEDHGSSAGSFDLSDWNVPFTAAPPPSDQIVELPH
jgi:hypothetical protein